MDEFDQFLQQTANQVTPATPQAKSTPSSSTTNNDADFDSFLQQTEPVTGADGLAVPDALGGMSASTPINSSPVSALDRFKLSLGNEQGQMDYLKQKFDGVAKDKDGELVVKQGGKWYRVDEKDSWELTKDLADLGGLAVHAGAAIGADVAAGLPTAGVGAVAGAAAANAFGAGVRMTMGRMVGTYKASAEEEARDLGLEALLGAGGHVVMAGAKPTAQYLGKALSKVAPNLDQMPAASKAMLSKYLSATTGASEEQAGTLLAKTSEVADKLKGYGSLASPKTIQEGLKADSIEQLKLVADYAKPALNRMYSQEKKQLLDLVPKDFNVSPSEPIGAIYAKGVEDGIIKVTAKNGSKSFTPEEALLALKSGNFSKYSLELAPQSELVKKAATGNLSPLLAENAINDEGYAMLSKFFDMTGKLVPEAGGVLRPAASENASKLAANRLIDTRKILSDTIYNLGEKAEEQNVSALRPVLMDYLGTMDAVVKDSLDKPTAGAYSRMLQNYNKMADTVDVFKRAKLASKNTQDAPLEALLNKFMSKDGNNVAVKQQLRDAASMISAHSPKEAGVGQALNRIMVNDSAKAFSSLVRPGVGKISLESGGIGAAFAINPVLGAGALVATSPKASMRAIVAARGVKDFLANMAKSDRVALLQNPQLLNAVLSKVLDVPAQAEQVSSQALGQ